MFFEVLRAYPYLSILFILGPLFGGLVGAYTGYDKLKDRFEAKRERAAANTSTLCTRISCSGAKYRGAETHSGSI
jgi:hypothetical protein